MDWKKIIIIILGICGSAGAITGILSLDDRWKNEPTLSSMKQEITLEIAKNRDIMIQNLEIEEFDLRYVIKDMESKNKTVPLYMRQRLESMQNLLKELEDGN